MLVNLTSPGANCRAGERQRQEGCVSGWKTEQRLAPDEQAATGVEPGEVRGWDQGVALGRRGKARRPEGLWNRNWPPLAPVTRTRWPPRVGGLRSGQRIHLWTDAITGVCGDAVWMTASSDRPGTTSAVISYSAATQSAKGW